MSYFGHFPYWMLFCDKDLKDLFERIALQYNKNKINEYAIWERKNYIKHLSQKCIVFYFFLRKYVFTQTYNSEFVIVQNTTFKKITIWLTFENKNSPALRAG